MWRDIWQPGARDVRLQHLPNESLADSITTNLITPVDGPEQMSLRHARVCVHASIAFFVQVGIGIVRTRPCLPTRSTMHQRLSRCWICFIVRFASSDRRNRTRAGREHGPIAQPLFRSHVRRVQEPLRLAKGQPVANADAVRPDALYPRDPRRQFRRKSPLSAASTASLRTAVIRTLIEIAPSPRASSATLAVTVAFVNPAGRGASANQDSIPNYLKGSVDSFVPPYRECSGDLHGVISQASCAGALPIQA